MRKYKIFGVGAGVIMILLAFSPIANGLVQKSNNNDIEIDLGVRLDSCEFQKTIVEDNGDIFSIYRVKYTIRVRCELELDYDLKMAKSKFGVEDRDINFEWDDTIEPSGLMGDLFDFNLSKTKDIYVRSSDDPKIDEEAFVATERVYQEIRPLYVLDANPANNKDYGRAKHWISGDYIPTKSQVLASSPYCYREHEIEYNGKIISFAEIIDPFNNSYEVPPRFKERLGYVYNLTSHILTISADIVALVIASILFTEEVYPYIKIISDWIIEGSIIFKRGIDEGQLNKKAFDKWISEFDEVFDAANKIFTAVAAYGGTVSLIVEKLIRDVQAFKSWILKREWESEIEIDLTVDLKNKGDFVFIECREFSGKIYDENNDQMIDESIYVSSEPRAEDPWPYEQWWIHDCTTYANKKDNNKQTLRIFSWAFAGGKISAYFDYNVGGSREIPKLYKINNPLINRWISSFLF
jgi:hypothetical protein